MPDSPPQPSPAKPAHPRIALTWPIILIACDKLAKGIALIALGITLLCLVHKDLGETIHNWARFFHLAPGNHYVEELAAKALDVPPHTIRNVGLALFLYAALYFVEGIGLLMRRHWAEWVVVISTATFIPLEIFEVLYHFGWIKLLALFLNTAILIYLIYCLGRDTRRRSTPEHPPAK